MPFLRLVAEGQLDAVRQALDTDPALVNRAGPHPYWGGRPQPLHVSIEMNQSAVFELLLERGAHVDGDNAEYGHWSPLMLAVQRGRTAMVEALLARGARVGLVDALLMGRDEPLASLPRPAIIPNEGSLLNFARTPAAIDFLLAQGESATLADCWGVTPAGAFSKLGPPLGATLLRRLAAKGVTVGAEEFARLGDTKSLEGMELSNAVLLAAVAAGQRATVAWLLDRGLNVNCRRPDLSRQTPLHEAAWSGDLELVQLLVARGADRQAHDGEHDATPAEWARTAAKIKNDPAIARVAEWLERP